MLNYMCVCACVCVSVSTQRTHEHNLQNEGKKSEKRKMLEEGQESCSQAICILYVCNICVHSLSCMVWHKNFRLALKWNDGKKKEKENITNSSYVIGNTGNFAEFSYDVSSFHSW